MKCIDCGNEIDDDFLESFPDVNVCIDCMATDFYSFDEYQERCAETDLGNVGGRQKLKPEWMYYVLGVAGEQGELLGKIKKLFRDQNGEETFEFKRGVLLEMGDILWYMARLADHFGMPFSDVPDLNIKKLNSRMDREKLQGDGDNR